MMVNKDQLKGKAEELKGKVTGDDSEELKGKVAGAIGKAKEKVEETVDEVAGKINDQLEKHDRQDS